MNNELYHYGVKGMQWGKRKKSYYDESDSPFSEENRKTMNTGYIYYAGREKTPGGMEYSHYNYRIKGVRPKKSGTDDHGNKKYGKGLYVKKDANGNKVSAGTGPVSGVNIKSREVGLKKATKNNEKRNVKTGGIVVGGKEFKSVKDANEYYKNPHKSKGLGLAYKGRKEQRNLTYAYNSKDVSKMSTPIKKFTGRKLFNSSNKLNASLKQTFNIKHRPVQAAITRGKSALKGIIFKLKRGY